MAGGRKKRGGRLSGKDIIVTALCLCAAAASLYFLRGELLQTLEAQNEGPVGAVIIIENNVQRRAQRRLLWDLLAAGSPVRAGDSVRTAEHSSVTLRMENSFIDADADTLLIVRQGGAHLLSGRMFLITEGGDQGFSFEIMGKPVHAAPHTILSAAASRHGMELSVSQGAAFIFQGGMRHEVFQGELFALNSAGVRLSRPAAVVTYPGPNARYITPDPGAVSLDFFWERIGLYPWEAVLMEIAYDRNFTQISQTIGSLDSSAALALEAGVWHWRMLGAGSVLSSGRIEIADSSGPNLVSPVADSLYRFAGEAARLRFQWAGIPEAESYIVEVSASADFADLQMQRQTQAAFLVEENLSAGDWYWRVAPVFPPVFRGLSSYSLPASFSVQQGFPQGFDLPIPLEEEPPEVRLLSPACGASLAGLAALRQPTAFAWEFDGEAGSSRFVLSRSPDPLAAPAVEIRNPRKTVVLNSLNEGLWYWTVEAGLPGGVTVSAPPRQIRVLPIPLLAEPSGRRPADGHVIGIPQLRLSRQVNFSWQPVGGANAYIFTLFTEAGGRREIIHTQTLASPGWLLEDINALYPGVFYWEVEAVNRNLAGVIQQRGRAALNSFTLDVPAPGPVFLEDPGVLYGG